MSKGKYYMVPLHMHTNFEGKASMRGHIYNAKKLGMEYIYITDHDFLMGKTINSVDGFSFKDGTLIWEESPEKTKEKIDNMFELVTPYGIKLSEEQYKITYDRFEKNLKNVKGFALKENGANCSISTENGAMRIDAKSSGADVWEKSVIEFYASGYRTQHSYRGSLLSGVTVSFPFEVENLCDDTKIAFVFEMSQQPPDFKRAGIKYVLGNTEDITDENYALLPAVPDKSGKITLHISEDAEKYACGGLDNTFEYLRIEILLRGGKSISCLMGDIKIDKKYLCEEAVLRQRELAEKIGKEYGVEPIVTNEITAAGQHKVSFCTKVPVIDYSDGEKSHEYAVEWVKKHGGIFSLNHPFVDWERVEMSQCDKPVAIRKLADEYIENKCWGASMIEVGFPCNRSGFSLEQHLALWDRISSAGIFITGYGDSDNHACDSKWFEFNNFCAYIYSENPCEESFVDAMKSGNIFTGDPVFFKGDAEFKTVDGDTMGSVIERGSECDEATVCLNIYDIPENCRLVWVIDGVSVSELTVSEMAETTLRVPLDKDINFVRANLYNADGRCIMLTNPIYFVKKGMFDIPIERTHALRGDK